MIYEWTLNYLRRQHSGADKRVIYCKSMLRNTKADSQTRVHMELPNRMTDTYFEKK